MEIYGNNCLQLSDIFVKELIPYWSISHLFLNSTNIFHVYLVSISKILIGYIFRSTHSQISYFFKIFLLITDFKTKKFIGFLYSCLHIPFEGMLQNLMILFWFERVRFDVGFVSFHEDPKLIDFLTCLFRL